jgi:hypothetical protein
MTVRRVILIAAGLLFAVPAFFFLTTDLLVDNVNCGTAMVPRDTDSLVLQTGDPIEDDFTAQVLRDECSQNVFRNRIITLSLVLVATTLFILAARSKPDNERFPGDPIV